MVDLGYHNKIHGMRLLLFSLNYINLSVNSSKTEEKASAVIRAVEQSLLQMI